jgi:hypothetical protein
MPLRLNHIHLWVFVYLFPRSFPMTGTLAKGFDEFWLLEDVAFPEDEELDDDVALLPLPPPISCPIIGTLAKGFDEF